MSLAPPVDSESGSWRASSGDPLFSKTCQNCFSLKIRCDRTHRKDICDRCARLGKHCVFRPAKRRDNSAKRDSRIEALESQVRDLLRSRSPAQNVQRPLPDVPLSATSSPQSDGDVIDEDIISIERADTLVEVYKSDMMPHFPFVIVPLHGTGTTLRHQKPFLFLALISVASFHDLAAQETLGNRFKVMVTEKVLFGGDDCIKLEYLQGLLIVLAWNQYHGRSKYFTQYLQLAISIAVDMRLDRRPNNNENRRPEAKRDPLVEGVVPEKYGLAAQAWGADEQRAAAGIFYISSTVSKLFDKMNTYACTPSMEEGCLALGRRAEYRTDKDLYHVIQLQKIIENIETLAKQQDSETDLESAYFRVRAQLEEFRAFMSADFTDSHLLFMQFHTAKLFLLQVVFFERNLQQSPARHLQLICEGLEEAKAFLDLFLWMPPKSEMALTNQEWVQLSFGVTQAAKFAVVSKLTVVEAQTRELRQRLNLDNVFRHLCLRIGALVGRASEANKRKNIFYYYEQRTWKIKNWYEKMAQAIDARNANTQLAGSSQAASGPEYQPSPHPRSWSTPSSYASSTPSIQQSPLQSDLCHAFQAPLSFALHQQQPLQGLSPQIQPLHGETPYAMLHSTHDVPATNMDMMPLGSYPAFGDVPAMPFPDMMSAPGWDTLFTVPMEDMSWLVDVSQGFGGMNHTSSPSNNSWGESGS